jgi:hypothetical protein
MLTSAKSVTSCGDGDGISVRKKKQEPPEPEIQCGSQRLPLYGGADPGREPAVKNERQQPAYVSDKLERLGEEKGKSTRRGEKKGYGPGPVRVVIEEKLYTPSPLGGPKTETGRPSSRAAVTMVDPNTFHITTLKPTHIPLPPVNC